MERSVEHTAESSQPCLKGCTRDIILAVEACPNGHRSIESNLISGVPARGLGR